MWINTCIGSRSLIPGEGIPPLWIRSSLYVNVFACLWSLSVYRR